jgi:serine phosphatase RsbU (regulator of sigma subunit)
MLPHETNLQTALKEYFVIYKPKDMVSGDFYWLSNKKDAIFVAVVDCTGHGVPGAFMSMIGISLLHEAINQQNIFEPAQVLQHINSEIRYALKQDETSNRDGMDLVLCKIEKQANNLNQITFSGAKRPLFYSQNGKICEIKGTRKNIGGNQKQLNNFEQHEFNLSNGEMLYLTTDGYADQANNNRENFGTQQLIILLEKINNKPTNEQQKILLQNLQEHQQQTDQRDDITVMGIRL